MTASTDPRGWWVPALAVVAAITALRLILLAFNRTDLFVDESQYWLWGQQFAHGYYSKPPLIAWLVGGVTALAGDGAFWVRAPGAVLHGATGLILGALAARLYGARAGFWTAACYVTLPLAAVGSLIMSTDTVMAPFFAAALYFHARLLDRPAMRWAFLAGAAAGVAFLAKYAAVYFLIGAGLGALLLPALRIAPRHAFGLLAAFGLVILPNILWNVAHDMSTVSHTVDNVGWLRQGAALHPLRMAEFFLSQFAVFGPVMFAALLLSALRGGAGRLLVFSLPALAIVTGQALLRRAYANWAVSAYFAGTVAAVAFLLRRPGWLAASLVINGAICVALPALTLMPRLDLGGGPLAARYLGRADLSRQIITLSRANGGIPVVVERRDVIADLLYTGAASGIAFHTPPRAGRPRNHYEQTYSLPDSTLGPVLLIAEVPPKCDGQQIPESAVLNTAGGAFDGVRMAAYLLPAACVSGGLTPAP